MSTSAENLARELADFRRRLAALERGTQLTTSTIGLSGGTVSIMQGLEAGVAAGAAAAEAITKAASAEAKADGAVHTYFGDVEPKDGIHIGDLWRDNDGLVHQFDGTEWVPISAEADLTEALDRIAHTEEALDGKVSTYYAPSTRPPGGMEVVTDGGFEADDIWTGNARAWLSADAAKDGNQGYHMTTVDTGNVYPNPKSGYVPTAIGKPMRIEMDVRLASAPSGTPAASDIGVALLFQREGGASTTGILRGSGTAYTVGEWRHLSWDYTVTHATYNDIVGIKVVPWVYRTATGAVWHVDNLTAIDLSAPPVGLSMGDLWIVTDGGNLIRRWNGTEWVDLPAGSAALADRAVTSTKLETDLVLSSRIIAGSQAGSRAEMNPDGFYVYDGDRELMRLGVAGASDYLTIMKDDGTSVAGITQAGTVNALGVSAGNKMWYKGRELTEILDELPLGILAVGKRTTRGPVLAPSNGWVQYMRIDATLWPGRRYRLSLGPVAAGIASGGVLGIKIRYQYDNVCTPTTGTQIAYQRISADRDTRGLISVPFEVEGTNGTARSVSFVVCYANVASGGQVNLTPDQNNGEAQPTYFTLEDMGVVYRTVSKGDAGAINVPADSVPGPVVPGVLDVYPTSRKNYVVDNLGTASAYTVPGASADTLYQGPWPSHGRRYVSAFNFNDAITPLGYGTPAGMLLLLNATQWHYANGGTVTLAPHGWTSLPNSFKLADLPTFRVESASFPNPGYRYIPIPSALWNHFKTGQYRGFVLIGDDTLDSSGVFANNPAVDANAQLPILQVGVIPTYSGGPA